MKRKFTSLMLTAVLLLVSLFAAVPSYAAVTKLPELTGLSAVLINADTGELLYDKYKDFESYPASTTKIMTALLTLENLELDQVCTISHNAAYTEGSRIFLLEGEEVTVEQLLYAMMLPSANDAAIALAEACAGDVDSFAEMMNKRAKELGAKNTHFSNPNGLPDETHVTTVEDMALIAGEAMKNETFRKIVSTYEYTLPPTNLQPEARLMHNSNRLLYDEAHKAEINGEVRPFKYDGILGVKTGYTDAARSCLVASAERDGMTLIGVVYRSEPETLYSDMIQLLDFGFDNFKSVDLGIESGDTVGKVRVKGGKDRKTDVIVKNDIQATVELMEDQEFSDDPSDYRIDIEGKELTAPVKKGENAGKMVIYRGDTPVTQFDIYAAADVEKSSGVMKIVVIFLLTALLAAALIVLQRIWKKKTGRRR